jgi:glucosylceramidase
MASHTSIRRLVSSVALAALLAGCGSSAVAPSTEPPPITGPLVQTWVTTADKSKLLLLETGLGFADRVPAAADIAVNPAVRYQTMVGFGASITDATAWLMMNRMSAEQRNALLQELFGRGPNGIGFDFTRLTIGASDFSRSHYSLAEPAGGGADMALASFSINANRADVLPVTQAALAINPQLKVMASPWSAPAWMKTTGSLIKGTLKPEMYDVFAQYLLKYVDAYAAEGVPIFALTVMNEPHFEPGDYPGMRLDPPQRVKLLAQHLGPLLAARGNKPQIIDWDHNWDEPQSPLAVLADPVARLHVSGVGWHCYAGQVGVMATVHDAHPDKDSWFTECSGGEWKTNWAETLPWLTRNIVIGATRGWAKGVLMWNLALDEKFGPHLGGCNDCRGVVTINSATGAVTRNMEYYALAHASKFVRPGAQRIDSPALVDGMETVAFRNADDGSIALIVCNGMGAPRRFTVTQGGQSFEATAPRESVTTYVWTPR